MGLIISTDFKIEINPKAQNKKDLNFSFYSYKRFPLSGDILLKRKRLSITYFLESDIINLIGGS
jgi:hypothetical protein